MIVLGLGANMNSVWGAPAHTIRCALSLFGVNGICVKARSPFYESAPLGVQDQNDFVNAVVAVSTALPPESLLWVLKRLERSAGPRSETRWGPRPLDIDILDYAGRIINWPAGGDRRLSCDVRSHAMAARLSGARHQRRSGLVTPHPQMHLRAFVLQPLVDILPRWHHPVSGESACQLLRALPPDRRGHQGQIRRMLSDLS